MHKPTITSKEDQDTSQCLNNQLNEGPTIRERIQYSTYTILPKLALPMALLGGSVITAGTTYALVRRVQNLIATATVSSDPRVWMQQARTRAYDACYFGCNDCNKPNYTFDACARTATANVTGVICDGSLMWNWKDRYPVECLQSLGEQYRLEALEARKRSYRNQLAIIILTVLGGIVGGIIIYHLWKRAMAGYKARGKRLREEARFWPGFWETAPWKRRREEKGEEEEDEKEREEKGEEEEDEKNEIEMAIRPRSPSKGSGKMKFLFISFPVLFSKASAYACTGHDPIYNQYFVNKNHTLFGVVHGWFSNCYDVTVCTPSCSSSCSGNSCSSSCTESCTTVTYSNMAPEEFVNYTLPKVEACGFSLVDAVEGDVSLRVANADIERNWWVKISVNGYNVTSIADTDEMVWCLYDIGNLGDG